MLGGKTAAREAGFDQASSRHQRGGFRCGEPIRRDLLLYNITLHYVMIRKKTKKK